MEAKKMAASQGEPQATTKQQLQDNTAIGMSSSMMDANTIGLIEEALATDTGIQPEFTIQDDAAADWAIRKIAQERAEYGRLKALADEQIEQIAYRIEKAKHRCESSTSYLTAHLQAYFEQVPHKTSKTQEQYILLSGKLKLKYGTEKFLYNDGELVAWMKENGYADLVKTVEKPAWAELKKQLAFVEGSAIVADTGELVSPIVVTRSPDEFTVEI